MGQFIDEIVSSNDLRSVKIEQWQGKEVFFTPFTLADMDWVEKRAKTGSDSEQIAYTIIRKCLDSEGKPLFDIGDKPKLMRNVQSDVLASIVIQMKQDDVEHTADELVKS